MNIQSQDFGVNTVCGSSRVPGLGFFFENCDIPLDIACGLASVSDLSSASSGRFGPVLGSLTSGPTQTIGPWTQHAGVAARLGSDHVRSTSGVRGRGCKGGV